MTASMTLVERVAAFLEPDIMARTGKDWEWRQEQERKYAQRLLDEAGVSDALETAEKALEHILAGALSLPRFADEEARDALAKLRGNR